MPEPVNYRVAGTVGVITIDSPPVNALSHPVRSGISEALSLSASDNTESLIMICDGRTFIAGADITEFGQPHQSPSLHDVLETLDQHPKLTIAAIHGTALGGGFETALTCHYRIALRSAKVGLPEVKLGLLPGAGGTQRVPRLAGVEVAIDLMTSGNPLSADKALNCGLLDKVTDEPLLESAIEYAKYLVASGAPHRRVRDIEKQLSDADKENLAAAKQTLAKKTRGETAPQRILDCIEAACCETFQQGLIAEQKRFLECLEDPQSVALRHLFFAERQASKIDNIQSDRPTLQIESVGIVGAGTMGGGIAMCFAQAGIPVTLLDMTEAAVQAGVNKIRDNYMISVGRGRFSEQQVNGFLSKISPSSDYQSLSEVDLVIEAVFENLEVKKSVFEQLDEVCKPNAILASNTSYQDIDEIASAIGRPDAVLGMHFFSPANVMKLLEVVRGTASSDAVISAAMGIAKRINKIAVLSGVCYGFIGNRMLRHYTREAALCLLEGATPEQVDGAMERWGMAMGPFAVADLAGLDIGYKAREQLSEEAKGDPATYLVADRLVEAGRLGQKSGAGYYRYDTDTRKRHSDPAVMDIVLEVARELGIQRGSISDEDIVDRLTLALANEGARILAEGIAQRASDIDVVYCYGYGFPRFRGGPMHNLKAKGIDWSLARIQTFAEKFDAKYWSPAPLLTEWASGDDTPKG